MPALPHEEGPAGHNASRTQTFGMKRILATLILATAAAACSSGGNVPAGSATTPGAPTPPATATATAPPTTKPASTASPIATVPTPGPDCYAMQLRYTQQDPVTSSVSVTVDIARGFGPGCPALAPGRSCTVPLAGSWRLMGPPPGAMRVDVYENDGRTPVHTAMFRNLGPSGQLARFAGFRYAPAKGVKKMRFTTALLDSTGRQVAITPEQVLPMPTCDPRRRS